MTFLLCDPGGASTGLTSTINGMTTHTHTQQSSIETVTGSSRSIKHFFIGGVPSRAWFPLLALGAVIAVVAKIVREG